MPNSVACFLPLIKISSRRRSIFTFSRWLVCVWVKLEIASSRPSIRICGFLAPSQLVRQIPREPPMEVMCGHLFRRYVPRRVIPPAAHAALGILAQENVLVVHRGAFAQRRSYEPLPVRGREVAFEEPRFLHHARRVVQGDDHIDIQPGSVAIYHNVRIPIGIYARSATAAQSFVGRNLFFEWRVLDRQFAR